ncbi:MAG TPA: transketolase C-terminal domain-containing protein [Chloroflexota bacterium]|nr:transketolase C-terminal domain-containing protein [Chloroflexota bacterium]
MAETLAMREVFASTLVELGGEYPNLVVLDGDLANSTRAEVFEQHYPDRFLEMGIAEQNMMGVAAGLATVGMIPWLSSFAVFLVNRDLDQLRMVVAQPNLGVKIGAGYAGLFTARTGKTHQEVSDLSVMRAMPHLTVVAPADGVEARQVMKVATASPGPWYVRLVRDATPVIFGDDYHFVLGETLLLRAGTDVTIFGTGVQTVRALEAADLLAQDGISAEVVHVPTLKPLNPEGIIRSAAKTGRVVTTEEHTIIGGLGSAVAEILGEHHPTPLLRHGLRDLYGESGSNDDLVEKYGVAPHHVAETVKRVLARGRT